MLCCNCEAASFHYRRQMQKIGPQLGFGHFGEAGLWSVEYDVVQDPGVERGAIEGGGKAWIVANTVRLGTAAGEDVGQDILEHGPINWYDNAAGDRKWIGVAQPTGEAHAARATPLQTLVDQPGFRLTEHVVDHETACVMSAGDPPDRELGMAHRFEH